MRQRDVHVRLLAITLISLGLAVCGYKTSYLGLPLQPGEDTETWTVQAQVVVEARRKPIVMSLLIPRQVPGFVLLDEDFISGGFGLAVETEKSVRRASWAVRRASGKQTLYYRLSLARTAVTAPPPEPVPAFPEKATYDEPYGAAVQELLEEVREESADVATFTRELLLRLNAATPDENVDLIRQGANDPTQWAQLIGEVLRGARIPTRVIQGLRLGESRNHAQLEPLIQVHNEKRWIYFNPTTGERGLPENFLVWHENVHPLVEAEGVTRPPEVTFAVTRSYREVVEVARRRAGQMGSQLIKFSLLSLPVNLQNVYRVLLMVPLGALLIVVLRNIVGLRTFGTFMPILIALAFRETQLLWGIVLFVTLVGVGLLFRFYLEQLRLLLVPRLAAVLTIVVILMAAVSVLSAEAGLQRGLSVALFPMVILAMTIERMSLVWEEHGPAEALIQGGGSLIVASLGYLVMTQELLGHLIFVFPELLLVVLGVLLLLGRYTGYRLSELWRFRDAVAPQ